MAKISTTRGRRFLRALAFSQLCRTGRESLNVRKPAKKQRLITPRPQISGRPQCQVKKSFFCQNKGGSGKRCQTALKSPCIVLTQSAARYVSRKKQASWEVDPTVNFPTRQKLPVQHQQLNSFRRAKLDSTLVHVELESPRVASTSALRFELTLPTSQLRMEVASLCSGPVVLGVAGLRSTLEVLQTMYRRVASAGM
jgi:hypothetical protein